MSATESENVNVLDTPRRLSRSSTFHNQDHLTSPTVQPTRRQQPRRKSANNQSADHDLAQDDLVGKPIAKRITKRRTKSESAVWAPGTDVATTKTGRIKRALKGQKVHKCHCGKIYTRNEHLRRHQLSHGDPPLKCEHPGCAKGFFRNDLHCRHMRNHESPDDNDHDTTDQQSSSMPTFNSSSMNPGSQAHNLDFLADTTVVLDAVPESTRDESADMHSLYQYAPLMTTEIPEHSVLNSYNDSSSWYIPHNGYFDANLAADSTDISSEFSYGSVLHQPSPAPAWSRSSFEQGSLTSTPGIPNLDATWSGEDLTQLLSMESLELSPMDLRASSSWYSTPTPSMSRTDSMAGMQADPTMTPFYTNAFMHDTTPTQERPLGLPSSFITDDGHPQAPSGLRSHIDRIGNYYNPIRSLIHNSQVSNGFVPASWVGLMTAIGLSGTGDHHVYEQAQTLFSSSTELLNSTMVPQDKLFRLTHMQLVWLAETFIHYRSKSPPIRPTRKFLRLCQAIQGDPEHLPSIDIAAAALNYVNAHPYSLQDSWRYWIYREGKRRLFLACYVWDIQQHLLLGRPRVMSDDVEYAMPHSIALWNAPTANEWYAQLQRESHTFSSQPRTFSELAGPKGIGYTTEDYGIIIFITLWNIMNSNSTSIPYPPGVFTNPFALCSYNALHMAGYAPIKNILAIAGSPFAPTMARTNTTQSEHIVSRWRHTPAADTAVRHAQEVLRHAYNDSLVYSTNDAQGDITTAQPAVTGPLHAQWSIHLAVLVCWACSEKLVVTTVPFGFDTSATTSTAAAADADTVMNQFFASVDLAIESGVPAADIQWTHLGLRKVAGWAKEKIRGTMGGLSRAACEVLARIEREI